MTELEAAAGRVRRMESGETLEAVYGGDRDSQFSRVYADQRVLYLEYLKEHPSTDSDPLTDERMLAAGAYRNGAGCVCFGTLPRLLFVMFAEPKCVFYDLDGYGANVPLPATMGDLRRLCKVLGIQLKEQA